MVLGERWNAGDKNERLKESKKSASESQAFIAFGRSLFVLTWVDKNSCLSEVVTG